MIVPTARDEGAGKDLTTVAKDEKIRWPTIVCAKIDTKTIFGMTNLKITLSTNSDKGVEQYLATDVMKLIKLYWLLDLSPMNSIDGNSYSNRKNSNLYLHRYQTYEAL